jgi:hypothetical protein
VKRSDIYCHTENTPLLLLVVGITVLKIACSNFTCYWHSRKLSAKILKNVQDGCQPAVSGSYPRWAVRFELLIKRVSGRSKIGQRFTSGTEEFQGIAALLQPTEVRQIERPPSGFRFISSLPNLAKETAGVGQRLSC